MPSHPLSWLFEIDDGPAPSKADKLLPVIEIEHPFQQTQSVTLVRQPQPFVRFWLFYRTRGDFGPSVNAMLVTPEGLKCWESLIPESMALVGLGGRVCFAQFHGFIENTASRGLTDNQFFGDYQQCLRRINEPRQRWEERPHVRGARNALGRTPRTPHIIIGDIIAPLETVPLPTGGGKSGSLSREA